MEKQTKVKKDMIKEDKKSSDLLVAIRIAGQVKVNYDMEDALNRIRLRKKYVCVLLTNKPENLGIIDKIKFKIAYGEINKETLVKLLKARAKKIDHTTFDSEKIADEIMGGKSLKELGFKPFFRLHPPRGGIDSKLSYPKGVLGNNKEAINKLVERML